MCRTVELQLACLMAFLLVGCGSSERDKIADRIEPAISPTHATDPDERREVAESLADDVIALRQDVSQNEEAQAEHERLIDAQNGTVEDAQARDCAMMRLELDALQRPSTEIRTAEEIAAIPTTIEDLNARLRRNCQPEN